MTGNRAIFADLIFPAIFAALVLVSVGFAIRSRKRETLIAASVGVLFFGMWAALGFVTFNRERHLVSDIAGISSAGMTSVQVGDKSYGQPADIGSIGDCL